MRELVKSRPDEIPKTDEKPRQEQQGRPQMPDARMRLQNHVGDLVSIGLPRGITIRAGPVRRASLSGRSRGAGRSTASSHLGGRRVLAPGNEMAFSYRGMYYLGMAYYGRKHCDRLGE